MRTVRLRLSQIYRSLKDEEQQKLHERYARNLEEEMELLCGGCNLPFGLEADSLEALPCSHILHARLINFPSFSLSLSLSLKKNLNEFFFLNSGAHTTS